MKTEIPKGEHGGECNRSACRNDHANFYNYSTRKYYCASCASLINYYNRTDALQMFGHDLCLREEIPLKK
jgi:hypothetical protein